MASQIQGTQGGRVRCGGEYSRDIFSRRAMKLSLLPQEVRERGF